MRVCHGDNRVNQDLGVTFGFLYEQMYDDTRRSELTEIVTKFTQERLLNPEVESKVELKKYFVIFNS